MARAWPWCFSLLLTRLVCTTGSLEDSLAITSCPTKADDFATSSSALLQVHKQQELVKLSDEQELLKLFAVLDQFDTSCFAEGGDVATRDAACTGQLVCARAGFDNRNFGDCPQKHCCSVDPPATNKERYDKTCWDGGSTTASRDASCKGALVCARPGFDSRNFGDCPQDHCCSQGVVENTMQRFDQLCYKAGSDMLSRDAACLGDLVCARKGSDSRDFGDCPQHHCCSVEVVANFMKRYDQLCYKAGSDMASRDAACQGDLVCARAGSDSRKFGDCLQHHCCSQEVPLDSLLWNDKSCYKAGSDMASRDASCQGALVCARKGSDQRTFGDCPDHHCCSEQARPRFDTTCYQAGKDAAARDASCEGDLVCARNGYEFRLFGDCPGRHCCSSEVVAGKAIYGVGSDGLVYKQLLSSTSSWSPWSVVGAGPMSSITLTGDRIFATGSDKQVYVQQLSRMTPQSSWTLAGKGDVHSVAVDADTIYAVGADGQVYKQTLSTMAPTSAWTWAGKGAVLAIAIEGDTIYGTGTDHVVYKQPLSLLGVGEGAWSKLGTGFVRSIAVDGDDIYGTGMSKRVWQQALSTMSPTSHWTLAATGDIVSIAVTDGADSGAALSLLDARRPP